MVKCFPWRLVLALKVIAKSINILFNKFAEPYKKKKKSLLIAIYSRHIYIRFINSVTDKNQ